MGAVADFLLERGVDSLWLCDEEAGPTLVDSGPGGKNLTMGGSGAVFGEDTGLVGVGAAVYFGPGAWAKIATPLTQVDTDAFTVGGFLKFHADNAGGLSKPMFCASDENGHTSPFYAFALTWRDTVRVRWALNNGNGFAPKDEDMSAGPTLDDYLLWVVSYNGIDTKVWIDGTLVKTFGSMTGNVGNMGSFAINTIPAIAAADFASDLGASHVFYHPSEGFSQGDVDDLVTARDDSGEEPPPDSYDGPSRTLDRGDSAETVYLKMIAFGYSEDEAQRMADEWPGQ